MFIAQTQSETLLDDEATPHRTQVRDKNAACGYPQIYAFTNLYALVQKVS